VAEIEVASLDLGDQIVAEWANDDVIASVAARHSR
jgi:hypothetical protein